MRALIAVLICAAAMAVVVSAAPQNSTWRPVVLMHGLFASNEAMSHAQQWIEEDFPYRCATAHTHTTSRMLLTVCLIVLLWISGIHTLNVEIGDGKWSSLLMNMNEQVAHFAAAV